MFHVRESDVIAKIIMHLRCASTKSQLLRLISRFHHPTDLCAASYRLYLPLTVFSYTLPPTSLGDSLSRLRTAYRSIARHSSLLTALQPLPNRCYLCHLLYAIAGIAPGIDDKP